jgi:hypothetical protein
MPKGHPRDDIVILPKQIHPKIFWLAANNPYQ